MKRVIALFFISILLTAIFSYSLNVFLKESFIVLSLKTMLVPCFTWTILILLAYSRLNKLLLLKYLLIAGYVCAVGSVVLVPGGIYNFIVASPERIVSVINVFVSVCIMSWMFYFLLKKNNFSLRWWWAFNILICINMTLFYLFATI